MNKAIETLLENRRFTFDRVVRLLLGAFFLFGMVWLLGYLSEVLIPFAIAFLLAYLFNPIVLWLQNHGVKNRILAVLTTLIIVFGTLGLAAYIVVPMVIAEIQHMVQITADVAANKGWAQKAASKVPPEVWDFVRENLKGIIPAKPDGSAQDAAAITIFDNDRIMELLKGAVQKIIPIGWGIFSGVLSIALGVTGVILILLYMVFLMLDFQSVRKDWQKLLPHNYRDSIVGFVHEFDAGMNRYFRAQATIASIVGILFATGFAIIDLPMGILLGLFIGALNMVPYLQTLGLLPAILLALLQALETDQSFWIMIVLVLVVFAVVQAIQDLVLTPKIMGDVTGLSPAIILLSLSIWGKLLGMLGLLIALPMTCLLLAYYKRLIAHQEEVAEKEQHKEHKEKIPEAAGS